MTLNGEKKLAPFKWSEPAPPTAGVSRYDHVLADTPFGRFSIEWKNWKIYGSYSVTFKDMEYVGDFSNLETAKQGAFDWFTDKIDKCYEQPG